MSRTLARKPPRGATRVWRRNYTAPATALVLAACSGTGARAIPAPASEPAVARWADFAAAPASTWGAQTCTAIAFADLDGDGEPDAIQPGGGLRVRFGTGGGAFGEAVTVDGGDPSDGRSTSQCGLAVADVDGDGVRDVVAVGHGSGRGDPVVYFGGPSRTFTSRALTRDPVLEPESGTYALAVLDAGTTSATVVVGRMNRADIRTNACDYDDTNVDIYCPSASAPGPLRAWRAVGGDRRALVAVDVMPASVRANALGLGGIDVDGDGHDDLIVASDFGQQFAVRAEGDHYADASTAWGFDVLGHGMSVGLGDLDGDGRVDAIVPTMGGVLQFARQSAGFAFVGRTSPFLTRRRVMWPWTAVVDDFDDDGHDDVMVVNGTSSTGDDMLPGLHAEMLESRTPSPSCYHALWFGRSDHAFDEVRLPLAALGVNAGDTGGESVFAADLDGDGALELALPTYQTDRRAGVKLALGQIGGRTRGHGITVRLSPRLSRSGTRVAVVCGGATHVREIFAAEGHSGAARTDAHVGCGEATRYDSIEITGRGFDTVHLPGGTLGRSVRAD